jgi:carboxylesterase type B
MRNADVRTCCRADSDFVINCEVRNFAKAVGSTHKSPVWRYLFTHRFENDPGLNLLRAFHTAELNFVFGNLQVVLGGPYTAFVQPRLSYQTA